MRAYRCLSCAFPLALGAALLCHNLARPWTGSYDANGALFSTVARNYLRHGLAATRGGQVANGGALGRDDFRFYTHHPPGLPLALAASFAVLGVHEWSARLVPIACTLGAAALVWLLARELGGHWAALLATLAFVAQPMVAFYGRMPDHEAPGALFALALAALYLRWQRGEGGRGVAWMSVLAFLGVWFAWVVAAVPWLLLACGLLARGRRGAWLAVPAAASLVGVATVFAHLAGVAGGADELWAALAHRTGSMAGDRGAAAAFGLGEFAARQWGYFHTCFSLTALAAAVAWTAGVGRAKGSGGLLVGALGLFGLANVVAFRQGAYVHIYYQFYLAAPLSLAAGLVLRARRRLRVQDAALVAVLLGGAVVGEGWWKLGRIRRASFYESQVAVARAIRATTREDDRVLVVWDEEASFRQLTYYADRNLTVVPDREAARRLLKRETFDGVVWSWVLFGPAVDVRYERVSPGGPRGRGRPPGG